MLSSHWTLNRSLIALNPPVRNLPQFCGFAAWQWMTDWSPSYIAASSQSGTNYNLNHITYRPVALPFPASRFLGNMTSKLYTFHVSALCIRTVNFLGIAGRRSRDFNLGPLEYELGVLRTIPWLSEDPWNRHKTIVVTVISEREGRYTFVKIVSRKLRSYFKLKNNFPFCCNDPQNFYRLPNLNADSDPTTDHLFEQSHRILCKMDYVCDAFFLRVIFMDLMHLCKGLNCLIT